MDEPWDTSSAFDDPDCDDDDLFFDFPDDNSDSDASDLEPDHFMPVPPPIDRVHYQPHTALTQHYAEARHRDLDEVVVPLYGCLRTYFGKVGVRAQMRRILTGC